MAMIQWHGENAMASQLDRISRDFDRLMAGLGRGGAGLQYTGVYPSMNLYDEGESLVVRAEIPGVDPKDIDVTVTNDTLTISGERKNDGSESVSYHRRERELGRFQRSMTLPDQVNSDKVVATCQDGILELRLPRAEQAKPRKVKVK